MSATEDGVTDLMASYLRDNGIKTLTQISHSTPGTRSQPDFQIENGGTFLGEAKWDDKKWEGFGEARDYGQLTGISGSFLITYPTALKQEAAQSRLGENTSEQILSGHKFTCAFLRRDAPTDMATLELEQVPGWIESNIQQRRRPEPDPDEVVRVLRQTAHTLNEELQSAPDENLFRNVLGADPEEDDEREAARQTAGFLLVNQLTFYRVLSSKKKFPEIDPDELSSPGDLGEYFDLVLEVDYTPVFGFKMADELSQESLPIVQDAIKTIYALSPENINHDILGKVFHDLIPEDVRRKVAAFYTRNESGQLLADLAIDSTDDKVLDPACGSGSLLAASYLRKKELSEEFDEESHKQFVENDITGIDVMPFSAHLSSIHLALQAPIYDTDEVNIGIEDSTKLSPGSKISPLSYVLPEKEQQRGLFEFEDNDKPDVGKETIEAGSVAMDAAVGKEMELEKVDVVIMNPPFTRQESIATFADGYKGRLRDRFSRRDSKGQIHGKMSYFGYFMYLADKFLDEGGRIATVLPANVLGKSTDSGVREMLIDEYTIEYVFAREDELYFSEDTGIREVMLIARKGKQEGANATYVSLDGLDVPSEGIRNAKKELEESPPGTTVNVQGEHGHTASVWQIPQNQLDTHNLFSSLAVQNRRLIRQWTEMREGCEDYLTQVKDIGANLTRGGSSHPWTKGCIGAPDAELRSSDVWQVVEEKNTEILIKHRHIGEEISVPTDAVEPYLLRKQYRKQLNISGVPEYTVAREFDGLSRFLSLAEEEKIPSSWEEHVTQNTAHLAIPETAYLTAPGTSHPVFYSDPPRVYHRMWMYTGIDQQEARILALWFDSSLGILQFLLTRLPGRGGWTKYRKYAQQRFVCPDVGALNDSQITELEECFEEVSNENAPSLAEQMALNANKENLSEEDMTLLRKHYGEFEEIIGNGYSPRVELDETVMDVLNMDSDRKQAILANIYSDLLMELVELKEIVDG